MDSPESIIHSDSELDLSFLDDNLFTAPVKFRNKILYQAFLTMDSPRSIIHSDSELDLSFLDDNLFTAPVKFSNDSESSSSRKSEESVEPPRIFPMIHKPLSEHRSSFSGVEDEKLSNDSESSSSRKSEESVEPPRIFPMFARFLKHRLMFSSDEDEKLSPYGVKPDSPAASYISMKSNQSKDRPPEFSNKSDVMGETSGTSGKVDAASPRATSVKSDQSGVNRKTLKSNRPESLSSISYKSEQSMGLPATFSCKSHITAMLEDCLKCSVCENVLKEPVFIPCGDTFCKTCIQKHLKEDCCCPKCRKRFETCPDLPLNKTLDHLLKQMGFSPALPAHSYAGPDDLTCDICTGGKIKAVKSCLTCNVSYCETHVRHHYTVEALNQHELVDTTNDHKLDICLEYNRLFRLLQSLNEMVFVQANKLHREINDKK